MILKKEYWTNFLKEIERDLYGTQQKICGMLYKHKDTNIKGILSGLQDIKIISYTDDRVTEN